MTWPRKMTAEQRARLYERVAELTREGWSSAAIAEDMGTTTRTVTRIRKATGTTTRTNPPPLTAEQLARAKDLLEDGAPYPEVARTLGCGSEVLRNRLPGYSWTLQQAGQYRAARRKAQQAGVL